MEIQWISHIVRLIRQPINRLFVYFIIISLIQSCSSPIKRSAISDNKLDILDNESMSRYDQERIVTISARSEKENNIPLKAVTLCYQNDNEKFIEAFNLLNNSQQLEKNNPQYWNALGMCHLKRSETKHNDNDIKKANFYFLLSLQTSTRVKAKNPYAYTNIGVIYTKNNRLNEAKEMFHLALKEDENALTPMLNLSYLYLIFKQKKRAQELLQKLSKKNENDPDVILGNIWLAILDNNYKQANYYFSKIDNITLNDDFPSLFYLQTLVALNQKDSAYSFVKNLSSRKLETIQDSIKAIKKKLEAEFKALEEAQKKEKKQG